MFHFGNKRSNIPNGNGGHTRNRLTRLPFLGMKKFMTEQELCNK
jgi:hypothetical protein